MRILKLINSWLCIVLFGSSVFAADHMMVPVSKAEEAFKEVTVRRPVQECHPVELQQQVEVPCPNQAKTDRNTLGIDTLLGAAAGAAIGGATIDRGKSSDTGKIVGGLLGAVGVNQARGRAWGKGSKCYETRTVTDQRCETRYESFVEKRSDGWLLCSVVNGEELCVKSKMKKDTLTVYVR